MQQFFWWRFYRSKWCPLTLKKLRHRDLGLNYHKNGHFQFCSITVYVTSHTIHHTPMVPLFSTLPPFFNTFLQKLCFAWWPLFSTLQKNYILLKCKYGIYKICEDKNSEIFKNRQILGLSSKKGFSRSLTTMLLNCSQMFLHGKRFYSARFS